MQTNLASVTTDEQKMRQAITEYMLGAGVAGKLNEQQQRLFAMTCATHGLNPMKKEIYAVPRQNKDGTHSMTIITSYNVYIRRANESGLLNGFSVDYEPKEGIPKTATCTIYRKDWAHPFVWTVSLAEVKPEWKSNYPERGPWISMPSVMLRKTAMSQAFRIAFPEGIAQLPYTAEEMGEDENDIQPVQTEAEEKKPVTMKGVPTFTPKNTPEAPVAVEEPQVTQSVTTEPTSVTVEAVTAPVHNPSDLVWVNPPEVVKTVAEYTREMHAVWGDIARIKKWSDDESRDNRHKTIEKYMGVSSWTEVVTDEGRRECISIMRGILRELDAHQAQEQAPMPEAPTPSDSVTLEFEEPKAPAKQAKKEGKHLTLTEVEQICARA